MLISDKKGKTNMKNMLCYKKYVFYKYEKSSFAVISIYSSKTYGK